MAISLIIDTGGGSNFENFHLRNVQSLHVGGSALASGAALQVTGILKTSSAVLVPTLRRDVDDSLITLAGGSDGTAATGGIIQASGDTHATTPGYVDIVSGADPASPLIRFITNATVRGTISKAGLFNWLFAMDVDGALDVGGVLTAAAGVSVTGNVTASGTVQGADLHATDDLTVDDDATITGDLTVVGTLTVGGSQLRKVYSAMQWVITFGGGDPITQAETDGAYSTGLGINNRWRPPRAGTVTALLLFLFGSNSRDAGSITCRVKRGSDNSTLLTAIIDGTNTIFHQVTAAFGANSYATGETLFVTFEASGFSATPGGSPFIAGATLEVTV